MKKNVIVLVNLGTPDQPTLQGVKKFLRAFLGDRRVVEVSRWIWLPILHLFILPFRSPKVARLYRKIWECDSPLRAISLRQVEKLNSSLQSTTTEVRLGMTYGEPGLQALLEMLIRDRVEKIIVLPLFPQFSATSTGAVYDIVARVILASRNLPAIHLLKDYHDDASYIAALASSIRDYWQQNGQCQKLLLSFHGIPKENVDKGDPYYARCQQTAALLVEELGLQQDEWALSFQSRVGKAEWLQPYTDKLLHEWGEKGVEDVDVVCPAFAADCLETLEEISLTNRQIFLDAGGRNYRYIPCLNDRDDHIALMKKIVLPYL